MDKQEYLHKIAEAAFSDEIEKVGGKAGFSLAGVPAAAMAGLRNVGKAYSKSYKNLTGGLADMARAGKITRGKGGVSRATLEHRARKSGMKKLTGSKLVVGTGAGGVALAGGGTAYAMNRKKD
jgi:hypothetical protein